MSWSEEERDEAGICSTEGATQETANYDDCRDYAVVTDYDVGYDFSSIMQYGLTE